MGIRHHEQNMDFQVSLGFFYFLSFDKGVFLIDD
jgi:hypothetical protein